MRPPPERSGDVVHVFVVLGLGLADDLGPIPFGEVGEPGREFVPGQPVADLDIRGRPLAEPFIEPLGDVGDDERGPQPTPGGSLAG